MMNVTPGEPIPPGFEDEINREAKIQSTVDQYKGNALIGIEYTLELHEDDRHEPGYMCLLCDKRGDGRTIINHWCSFNHRMKYLEKHYPSAVREFQPVKYKPNSHNIMILIVQSLSEAIEDHHGRLKVTVMNADEFRRRKTMISEQIIQKFHYDEKNGPNFLNAIDRTLWEQQGSSKKKENIATKTNKRFNTNTGGDKKASPSNNKNDLDEISSDSDNPDVAKKPKTIKTQEPAFTNKQRIAPTPAASEEPDKKLPTPKELSLQASHIAQERYKWEKYRCMLEIQLKQMQKLQSEYEKAPEKDPHYPEEWKKFWNRRYKELQAEKKVDPNKYDYKPEWIVFWTKRMKEIFSAEVEKKKKEIKIKLGLPENAEEKIDQLKEKYKVPVNRLSSLNKSNPRANAASDVIDISDDDSPRRSRYQRSRRTRSRSRSRSPRGRQRDHRRTRSRTRSRSLSPFSDDFELTSSASKHHLHKKHHNPIRPYNLETSAADYYSYGRAPRYPLTGSTIPHYQPISSHHYRILDPSKIPKYEESDSRSTKDSKEEPKDEEPDGPLTVVAVLRLLTALEEHLGSLGPKVVDLLGKALALEKVKANSSDDLLMNEDHCVFFETIKEKLKGLLIADVIEDQQKVRAVKKAIKNIAAVIHQVTAKAPIKEATKDNEDLHTDAATTTIKNNLNKTSVGPSIKDLPFDRQTVATKMAAALVMQGREDVSTADMDKLIYMFILMVKLSKPKREDDGKPLYCNDILPALGIRRKPPSASVSLAVLPSLVNELLESEVSALVQEVEDEIDTGFTDREAKNDSNSSMLESLTDSDLQTLLQNFKHLSSEEQHHLISHLKKLESADPNRVEKLRKFVNISDLTGTKESSSKLNITSDSTPTKSASSSSARSKTHFDASPPSVSRRIGKNALPPGTEDDEDDGVRKRVNPNKFSLDDDEDDDYNFDDVFKAASSNVNRLSEEHSRQSEKNTTSPIIPVSSSPSALTFNPAGLKSTLNDTQNLIANIMGSLQQSNSSSTTKTMTSTSAKPAPKPVPPIEQQVPPSQMLPQQQTTQMAFYQQQQQQQQVPYPGSYNQMNPAAAQANYYNSMGGGYNQTPYDNYSQWGGQGHPQNMPPQNMQYGIQGFGMQPQQMGYNMYGQGHN